MKLPSSKNGFVKLDRVAADNAKMRSDERWAHILQLSSTNLQVSLILSFAKLGYAKMCLVIVVIF